MKGFVLGLALVLGASGAAAQTIEELRALATGRSAELNEYRLLLQSVPENEQIVMINALLQSQDAELRQLAMDFAVFSNSKKIKLQAVQGFLNSGAPVLVELANVSSFQYFDSFILRFGGTFSEERGDGLFSYLLPEPKGNGCWGERGISQRKCEFEIVGDQILFGYVDGISVSGTLELTDDGVLAGTVFDNRRNTALMQIDLKKN